MTRSRRLGAATVRDCPRGWERSVRNRTAATISLSPLARLGAAVPARPRMCDSGCLLQQRGEWVMPPDGIPTIEDIRKRVISELVDADVRFARRRHLSRRRRVVRSLRRQASRVIG